MVSPVFTIDDRPQYTRLDSFFGKEWVFNVLHNFGGRRGIYGNLDRVYFYNI